MPNACKIFGVTLVWVRVPTVLNLSLYTLCCLQLGVHKFVTFLTPPLLRPKLTGLDILQLYMIVLSVRFFDVKYSTFHELGISIHSGTK